MSARAYARQSASHRVWQRISFLSKKSNTYNYAPDLEPAASSLAYTNPGNVRWIFLAASILAIACLTTPAAIAQSAPPATSGNPTTNSIFTDTPLKDLSILIGGSVRNDSNLFRQSGGLKTADTITTGYVGLRLDKAISQQKFQLEVMESTSRYANTSRLNSDALNYKGAWQWHATPRISGTLSANRSESLAPFEDTPGSNQRNVTINEQQAFDIDGWISGGWHLLGGIGHTTRSSDQLIQTQPDFSSDSINAGVKYLFRSGNSLSAMRRASEGKYQNLSANPAQPNYQEDQSELNASWALSGKSTISGRLAWLQRRQDGAPERDFSGPTANVSYSWQPTGKLNVAFAATRTTGPLQDPSFNYVVNDSLSVAPSWALSAKTAVTLSLTQSTLDYRGTGPVPPTGPARSDTINSARIGLSWVPMPKLSLGASLETQKRSSNTPGIDYNATIGSINAALTF